MKITGNKVTIMVTLLPVILFILENQSMRAR